MPAPRAPAGAPPPPPQREHPSLKGAATASRDCWSCRTRPVTPAVATGRISPGVASNRYRANHGPAADAAASQRCRTSSGKQRSVSPRRPPQIDGRLDDAVWETATHITEFVQVAPVEGAPGTEATEVWMAFDREHLYFAFYAHYSDPGMMRTNRADRDDIRGDDRMSVLFDPFLDQQRAYQFEVNGYGVQSDSLVKRVREQRIVGSGKDVPLVKPERERPRRAGRRGRRGERSE